MVITMSFFERTPLAPIDPILGLAQAFKEDPRPIKVNLGVGSYRTAALTPLILTSVKESEKKLLLNEKSKDYLPIEGDREYLKLSYELLFGRPLSEEVGAAQTVGGTGALRIVGKFLESSGLKKIHIPTPTWGNHRRIFTHAGLEVEEMPYYDDKKHLFDFANFILSLEKMKGGSVVLLHAVCHNPTGIDPTLEQWKKILEKMKERELFPFFDIAYQGFGKGIEEDAEAIRLFREASIPMAVAMSYSKNFGLYGERVGALFFICKESGERERIMSQIKVLIRGNYSNPPLHGAAIVREILHNPSLKALWLEELDAMRSRIDLMRNSFTKALEKNSNDATFSHIAKSQGMFAFTGLAPRQVEQLIMKYGIYMTNDGRINLAGLNDDNIGYVVKAINLIKEV